MDDAEARKLKELILEQAKSNEMLKDIKNIESQFEKLRDENTELDPNCVIENFDLNNF